MSLSQVTNSKPNFQGIDDNNISSPPNSSDSKSDLIESMLKHTGAYLLVNDLTQLDLPKELIIEKVQSYLSDVLDKEIIDTREKIKDKVIFYLKDVLDNEIIDTNISNSLDSNITYQKIQKIKSNGNFDINNFLGEPNLLGPNYVNGRVYGIRHCMTAIEGKTQTDNEPILDSGYIEMDILISKIRDAGLGNNVYLYSNNRTLRIKQTANYFIEKLQITNIQNRVSSLDTTQKSLKKDYRLILTNATTENFVNFLEEMGKQAMDFGVICIIHSTNQDSFENYEKSNPFGDYSKLPNLGYKQLDIGSNGIIDYNNIFNIYCLNIENIKFVPKMIYEYKNKLLSINDKNNTGIRVFMNELCSLLNSNDVSIWNKQNYFNNKLINNKQYILELFDNVFYDDINFAIFAISNFTDNYEIIDQILKKLFSKKLDNNKENSSLIYKLILLLKSNNNYKSIIYLVSLLHKNKKLFKEMMVLYYKNDKKLHNIFQNKIDLYNLSNKIRYYALVGNILFFALIYFAYKGIKQVDYGKNFFKDSTISDEKLKIDSVNFNFIDKSTNYHLDLSHIKTIDIQQLYYLMQLNLFSLDLSGIQYLDEQCASELSKFKGNVLNLNGLKSITSKQFDLISKFCKNGMGRLYLDSLENVDLVTMDRIIAFQGENISLNGLNFEPNESTFLRFVNVFNDNILTLDLDKYGFSDNFIQSLIKLVGNSKYLEYFNEIIQCCDNDAYLDKVNNEMKSMIITYHNINDFIKLETKTDLLKRINFTSYIGNELFEYFVINNFFLKSNLYNNLEKYVEEFIQNNLGPLNSFMIINKLPLIYEANEYFEKLFISFLKNKLPIDEFDLLVHDLKNKDNYINKSIIDFYTEDRLQYYLKQQFSLLIKSNVEQKYFNLTNSNRNFIYDISSKNSIKLKYILSFLDPKANQTLIIRNTESVSLLKSYLSNLNIDLLILYTNNIDELPNFTNVKSLFINPKNFVTDQNHINMYKNGNFDYVVYYPISEFYQFGNIVNNTYKYFKINNFHKKGIFIDFDDKYSLFPSMLKDSDVLRMSNLNVDNLHLGTYYFNEVTANYFSKRFKKSNTIVNREIKLDLNNTSKDSPIFLMSKLPVGIIPEIQNLPNIIQSVSNDFTVSSIILNGFVDVTNINIFQPIKLFDTTIEYSYNKSLYFSNLKAINLKAFTVLKDAGINCFYTIFREVKHQDSLIYTIDLIIDDYYNEKDMIANLNDFIKWIKITGLVFPTHSKTKFKPIFKGKQNKIVIKILKDENILSNNENLPEISPNYNGNNTGFNDDNKY
ncbi:MAG: hypothetical protein V3575_01445 [Candidatus Absconditabacteria bacterium]